MHYRTDLFGDADLQAKFEAEYGYPLAPPTTIEQMQQMAEFFVAQGVVDYGTQFAGKEEALAGRFYELLVANGGNYFDDNFEPIFNYEAGEMTAQWMKDLYEAGAIPSDTTNLLWPEVAQNFCDGKVAFYLEWYGWYSYFQDPEKLQGGRQVRPGARPVGAGQRQAHRLGRRARLLYPQGRREQGRSRPAHQVPQLAAGRLRRSQAAASCPSATTSGSWSSRMPASPACRWTRTVWKWRSSRSPRTSSRRRSLPTGSPSPTCGIRHSRASSSATLTVEEGLDDAVDQTPSVDGRGGLLRRR